MTVTEGLYASATIKPQQKQIEQTKGEKVMSRSYYGCCGFCKYMNLYSGYKFCSTTFKCERFNHEVKASEKCCSKFEPDSNRSNSMIEKYDR